MRFYGKVGYGIATETAPGVWNDVITEISYFGDVIRNSRQLQDAQSINPELSVSVSISIVADAFASENFFAIRYVEYAGALWTVSNVEPQRPRLLLRLGGVYNGPKVATP
jgi:hypothetical protein